MKNFAVLSFLLVLGACGFQPLHGYAFVKGENNFAGFQNIEISNIPDSEGQYLRNALIDKFYREGWPVQPEYVLVVAPITETKRALDITIQSDTTREQLRLDTSVALTIKESGSVLMQRNLYALSSFNVLENEFATRISENSSRENALDDLARQIELQIALYMKR